MGCLRGVYDLDFKIEEMGSWSELVGDEGVGLMVSGFRGGRDRVSREANSCSPSSDSFFPSAS